LDFSKEVPRIEVLGPCLNLLPNALGRVIFANKKAVFQDLVLKKRRRLSENDQIYISPESAGQVRLKPQSFAAGNGLFHDDRQVDIAAPVISAGCHGSK
jgi:hypothetical protein